MQRALFEAYLKALAQVVQAGDAREESFYPSLAQEYTICYDGKRQESG
jgi:hypothetical protein